MQLINKISNQFSYILYGKVSGYRIKATRENSQVFRVINENGGILYQGTLGNCKYYKQQMEQSK